MPSGEVGLVSCPTYFLQVRPNVFSRETSWDDGFEGCPMLTLSAYDVDDRPGVLACVKGSYASRTGFAALDPASALQVQDVMGAERSR